MTRKTVKSDTANQTAKKILQMRTPVYRAGLATIENQFILTVKELKKEIANESYFGMNLGKRELSIDKDNLEHEVCIALLDIIPLFDGSKGTKFLTCATPSILNTMTDLKRDAFSQYKMRMIDIIDGLAFQKNCLRRVLSAEEQIGGLKRLQTLSKVSRKDLYRAITLSRTVGRDCKRTHDKRGYFTRK